jgi:cardiolipin synthase
MFNRDLAESETITLDQWKDRPLMKRVKEMIARPGKYWL